MNITHSKISAAASGEHFCRYSLVRRVAAGFLVASVVMVSAVAGPRDRDRDRDRDERDYRAAPVQQQAAPALRDAGRNERSQARQEERRDDARAFDLRADEQRRNMQAQQEQNSQEALRRSARLTPDERRDLRRQINEAGMDLYPNRPRR